MAFFDALTGQEAFTGFTEEDFDAFARKKWASRVYTMERRSARAKVVALARSALAEHGDLGLEQGASDDAPSIANNRKVDAVWTYLTRPDALRKALGSRLSSTNLSDAASLFDLNIEHQHASLVLQIDNDSFFIELQFATKAQVDRTNAMSKLAFEEDRTRMAELCAELPEATSVGFGETHQPATAITPETVEGWGDSWETAEPFSIRHRWHRDEEQLRGDAFQDTVNGQLAGLLPIYQHLAWSPENDFAKVGVEKTVEKVEKKLKKAAGPSALEPGTRVTILSGLFAGRGGYLAEIDGKGQAKVMVGPVSVNVPASDVKPV